MPGCVAEEVGAGLHIDGLYGAVPWQAGLLVGKVRIVLCCTPPCPPLSAPGPPLVSHVHTYGHTCAAAVQRWLE